jgi:hypothetical protein
MDYVRNTEKMYQTNLHKKQPKGRPKARWKDDVEDKIRKMGVVNWRKVVQDTDGWRRATGKAHILLG